MNKSITYYTLDLPAEPPADSWQNSNKPSNTGQSSPTLTERKWQKKTSQIYTKNGSQTFACIQSWSKVVWNVLKRQWALTSLHLLAELRHVVWPYGSKELDVVVTVVLCHLVCSGFVWPLRSKQTNPMITQMGRRDCPLWMMDLTHTATSTVTFQLIFQTNS